MDRRHFIGTAAFAGIGGALGSRGQAAATTSSNARFVRAGPSRLLVVEPARGRGAGVLLQPTIAAINPYIRQVAAELAALGYTVVAWDPYDGEEPPADTRSQFERSRKIQDEQAMRSLRGAVDYMVGPLRLRSVATIGWCLGGRYALLHGGLDPRVSAVVAYHPTIYSPTPVKLYGQSLSKADFPGQTLDEFALARRIACPVQVLRPGHDLAQPAEYDRLQAALYARPALTDIQYYPQAAHGFPYEPEKPGNGPAAALAWPATLALLAATRA